MDDPQEKQTIAIVGSVGLPAKYGGWETLADHLARALTADFDVTVFCSSRRYDDTPSMYGDVRLEYVNLDANGVSSTFYDIASFWKARKFDKVLVLGISGCIALPFFRLVTNAEYSLNMDGLEWKRQKWSRFAKLVLRVSEAFGCRASHKLIADNPVIQRYIQDTYSRSSVFIPYGGDSGNAGAQDEVVDVPALSNDAPYGISVCRVEPENNTHLVLEAFAESSESLVYIGNWDASQYGRDLKARYGAADGVTLLDPIYDRTILDGYRAGAAFYVHGHSAGGTNPSLVEAMSLGLPVVAYDVDFNREVTHGEAIYFSSAKELAAELSAMTSAELVPLATRMKTIADDEYTWAKVAQAYREALFS